MKYTTLPVEKLSSWARLNNVMLNGISITSSICDENGKDKGGGMLATKDHQPGDILLNIPPDLILCSAQIDDCAKSDSTLREILDAVRPVFSKNSRKKVLIFLILQLTYSALELQNKKFGIGSPFVDYIKMLPKSIPLPTFFSSREQELLYGTSLSEILSQKLDSLQEEFDYLQKSTSSIPWCRDYWWDDNEGILCLDDWKLVDAIYRSRSVGLPHDTGTAMVPILDMANHDAGSNWNARFDVDSDGGILLVVADDKHIKAGEEINIMYSHAGACEMLFSYGFIENDMTSAREVFLSLGWPNDDPLAMAKSHFADSVPGVRLFHDSHGKICWDSPLVWWSCVNEEDGLAFGVAQTNEGTRELEATWKGIRFHPTDSLEEILMNDGQKDIFLLRANVMVQQTIEAQGQRLTGNEELLSTTAERESTPALAMIRRLRKLELEMLKTAYQHFDLIKEQLLQLDSVQNFLGDKTSVCAEDIGEASDYS